MKKKKKSTQDRYELRIVLEYDTPPPADLSYSYALHPATTPLQPHERVVTLNDADEYGIDAELCTDACDDLAKREDRADAGQHRLLAGILYQAIGREQTTQIMYTIATMGGLERAMKSRRVWANIHIAPWDEWNDWSLPDTPYTVLMDDGTWMKSAKLLAQLRKDAQ